MPEYQAALDRLASFRDSRNVGEMVDADSGLTADDLDLVIERATRDEAKRRLSAEHGAENWDGPAAS